MLSLTAQTETTTTIDGRQSTWSFDAAKKTITIFDEAKHQSTGTIDAQGRVTQMQVPNVLHAFEALGPPWKVEHDQPGDGKR